MKLAKSFIATTAVMATLGLTACGGTSEEVTALETILSTAEADIKACESKTGIEMSNCVSARLQSLADEWGKQVTIASEEDPEAVSKLVDQYTQLSQSATDLISKAFQS
jgi:hypothetical protein